MALPREVTSREPGWKSLAAASCQSRQRPYTTNGKIQERNLPPALTFIKQASPFRLKHVLLTEIVALGMSLPGIISKLKNKNIQFNYFVSGWEGVRASEHLHLSNWQVNMY